MDKAVYQIFFGVLEEEDFFFDGIWADHAYGDYVFVLADAVSTVDGLVFYGGVPPGVYQVYVIGFGQVEASAAGFEADEEYTHGGIILEGFDGFGTVTGLTGEVREGDVAGLQLGADEVKHGNELREHQDLVVGVFVFDVFDECIDLGGLVAEIFVVFEDGGRVADLTEFGKALEDVHALGFDLILGCGLQEVAELAFASVVDLALFGAHFAVQYHFGFLGQLGGYLFLCTAQDERIDAPLQGFGVFDAFELIDRHGIMVAEVLKGAQQPGAGKRELAVKIEGIVFYGGTAQRYAVSCA